MGGEARLAANPFAHVSRADDADAAACASREEEDRLAIDRRDVREIDGEALVRTSRFGDSPGDVAERSAVELARDSDDHPVRRSFCRGVHDGDPAQRACRPANVMLSRHGRLAAPTCRQVPMALRHGGADARRILAVFRTSRGGTTIAEVTDMLRIMIDTARVESTLRLEGRLAGPWVDELARVWAQLRTTSDAGSTRIDLDGLTFVSEAGRSLLRRLHEEGAELVANGCMTRAIAEDLRS